MRSLIRRVKKVYWAFSLSTSRIDWCENKLAYVKFSFILLSFLDNFIFISFRDARKKTLIVRSDSFMTHDKTEMCFFCCFISQIVWKLLTHITQLMTSKRAWTSNSILSFILNQVINSSIWQFFSSPHQFFLLSPRTFTKKKKSDKTQRLFQTKNNFLFFSFWRSQRRNF